jgi:hypothetical protein
MGFNEFHQHLIASIRVNRFGSAVSALAEVIAK